MILKIAFVLAVMAAGILLYGYWHAATVVEREQSA